jgi:hypothetical protein
VAIISDNQIDHDLAKMKVFAENLKKSQTAFSHTYQNLPFKERARLIIQIQKDQSTLKQFVDSAKKAETFNSGTKFAIENLKLTYQTIMTLWRKVERQLNNPAE